MIGTPNRWMVIPAALALTLTGAGAALCDSPAIQLAKNFPTDPIVVNGTTGGPVKTRDCGSVAQTPNQVVSLTNGSIDYMRMSVTAEGDPTLVVQGPGGRFCVLADKRAGENPHISGFWPQGVYKIYVGDRSGAQHPYTLSLTQKRK
jgi:hypothetical protein